MNLKLALFFGTALVFVLLLSASGYGYYKVKRQKERIELLEFSILERDAEIQKIKNDIEQKNEIIRKLKYTTTIQKKQVNNLKIKLGELIENLDTTKNANELIRQALSNSYECIMKASKNPSAVCNEN